MSDHHRVRILLLTVALTLPAAASVLASSPEPLPGFEADRGGPSSENLPAIPGPIPGAVQQGGSGADVGGSPVTFFHYPAPGAFSFSNGAGETSIGANLKSRNTLFQMALDTARVHWDDTAVPPAATWEDVSFPTTATTSLDPILWTDQRTGRTFVLQDLGESAGAFTDNDGATWVQMGNAGTPPSFDHQTIGGGPYHAPLPSNPTPVYPDALYYCAQLGVVDSNLNGVAQCARSDNGGLTFGPGVVFDNFDCFPIHGHVVSGPDGSVYVPMRGCGSLASGKPAGVIYSRDNGVTWANSTVPGTHQSLFNGGSGTEFGSDAKLAFDAAGKMYFVAASGTFSGAYSAATQTGKAALVATSTDNGLTWSAPVDVGASFGVKNVEFPAVVAGDAGRAAVMFYGSTTGGNDQLSSYKGAWHIYVAFTYDGGATWSTVDTTPNDPVQVGCIWNRGGSNPCRNLLDFQDMTVDREGRVVVGYADGCIRTACISAATSGSPDPGLSRDSYGKIARQTTGKRLFAAFDPPGGVDPLAVTAGGPYRTQVGTPVTLSGLAYGGTPGYAYAWDFDGDGVTDATGASPSYPATTFGAHTLTLTVTDSAGRTASSTAQVLVRQPAGETLARSYSFDNGTACDAQGWTTSVGAEVRLIGVSAGGTQWHTTTDRPASAPCAWYHGDDTTKQYTVSSATNLVSPGGAGCFYLPPNAAGARLVFNLAGASEAGFDFLHVQARNGCGSGSFADLGGLISGKVSDLPNYVSTERSLDDLIKVGGGGPVQVRFRFVADESVTDVGFQVDDVKLLVKDAPPTLASPGDRSVDDLHTMSFTLSASDPDLDPLTFSATGLPAGATLDSATGAFRWAPTFDQAPGDYPVTFRVTDGLFTASQSVTLHALNLPPVAAGSASTLTANRVDAVNFTDASSDPDGTVASWAWSFGDGASSAQRSPAHTYAKLGTFTPALTVTDNDGASATVSLPSITVVNLAPRAAMDAPGTANRVDAVQFRDLSTDRDGSVASRRWDFGDGNTSTDANPAHTFSTLGAKTVKLTVTDNEGASTTTQQVLTVVNLLPQPAFSTTPAHPVALTPTVFNDQSTDRDGSVVAWAWDFGDGQHSTLQNPVNVYAAGGLYTVTLKVTDNDGGVRSTAQQVFVCNPGVNASLQAINLQHLRVEASLCLDVVPQLPPLP